MGFFTHQTYKSYRSVRQMLDFTHRTALILINLWANSY